MSAICTMCGLITSDCFCGLMNWASLAPSFNLMSCIYLEKGLIWYLQSYEWICYNATILRCGTWIYLEINLKKWIDPLKNHITVAYSKKTFLNISWVTTIYKSTVQFHVALSQVSMHSTACIGYISRNMSMSMYYLCICSKGRSPWIKDAASQKARVDRNSRCVHHFYANMYAIIRHW